MCNGSSTLACFERLKSELVGRRGGMILTIKRNFGSSLLVEGAIAATATAMAVDLLSECDHATEKRASVSERAQLFELFTGKTNYAGPKREARSLCSRVELVWLGTEASRVSAMLKF